jgi:hypothetical protein
MNLANLEEIISSETLEAKLQLPYVSNKGNGGCEVPADCRSGECEDILGVSSGLCPETLL